MFIALVGRAVLIARWVSRRRAVVHFGATSLTVLASAYVAFRVVSPYTFASSNWLDLSVNESFRKALANQARATSGDFLWPPSYQWLLAPRVWSPLENLVVWQLGVPLGIAALAGLAVMLARMARAALAQRGRPLDPEVVVRLTGQLMLLSFVGTVFFWVATRFAHTGRYRVPIGPLLAVAAAYGLAVLTRDRRRLRLGLAGGLVALTAIYAVAFAGIYTTDNTRMAASAWIAKHVPLGRGDRKRALGRPAPGRRSVARPGHRAGLPGAHRGILVPVFDPDDDTKLRKLYDQLALADYYVLSSPRAWNTIGRLPNRFPLMARFYDELFAGRLGFVRAASFTSYPSLFGLQLDDLRAEEAFWVYDHPPVRVYRRVAPLQWDEFKATLCPEPVSPHCV